MSENSLSRRNLLKLSGATLLTGAGIAQTVKAARTTISSGEKITGTIDTADDQDVFELPVSQGDVVEIEFEKGARNQTKLAADAPRTQDRRYFSIELGGSESEGEETYLRRYTIEKTGSLEIEVDTRDYSIDEPQSYSFSVTRYDGLDEWPANDSTEITAGQKVTGTIRSGDDQDAFELPVSQGDVVEIEFEKGARNQTKLAADAPRTQGRRYFSIELGGSESEGEETYLRRYTIEKTGSLEIEVDTHDFDNPADNEVVENQSYTFKVTRYDGLDEWPANDPAEITAGEEVSGTIRSGDDQDAFELLVDQGDVIEVEFEKGARNQTKLAADAPRTQGQRYFSIELGGSESEGSRQFEDSITIEETGVLEIDIDTSNLTDPAEGDVIKGQDWRFIINGNLSPRKGEVAGTVTDNKGDPLEGVTLEFADPNTEEIETTTTTDDSGKYSVELASNQTYEILVEEDGYERLSTEVAVESNTTQTVNIRLTSEDGSKSPDIDVTGDGNPATDVDGDGKLEDINGDGELDIFDVQTLYNNIDSDVVQNNPEVFDFSESGGNPSIFDVQALYRQV